MKTGSELIAEERQRQIEKEGWTPEHDDEHGACEMSMAASAYIEQTIRQENGHCHPDEDEPILSIWPWVSEDWKPSDSIRNLVKAGALIAAEIDRLQRR